MDNSCTELPVPLDPDVRVLNRDGHMFELTLLGTDACHLCEQAQALLLDIAPVIPEFSVYLEDIAESEADVERYGVRIPVLRHDISGLELDWPFERQQCLQWIQSLPRSC
jgi:hypothetical protein